MNTEQHKPADPGPPGVASLTERLLMQRGDEMADQTDCGPWMSEAGDALSPQALSLQLANLIQHYTHRRSSTAAHAVLQTLDRLRQHPGNQWDMADRCACLRLRTHWQMLAQTSRKG